VRLRSAVIASAISVALGGCGASESHSGQTSVATASSSTPPAQTATATQQAASTSAQVSKPAPITPPAQTPSSSKKEEPKPEEQLGGTPFLDATGSGFAAFHQYISKPLRRGTLKPGARAAMATAAQAAAYAKSEIAAAAQAAGQSGSLQRLVGPLEALEQRMSAIEVAFDAGRLETAAVVAARGEVNAISETALAAGQPIQEVVPKLP
jgi:hypothetical protein